LPLPTLTPDFAYARPAPDSEVLFRHRKLDDGDLYFLTDRKDRAESIEAPIAGFCSALASPLLAQTRLPADVRRTGGNRRPRRLIAGA
jgi:hypothetical protein